MRAGLSALSTAALGAGLVLTLTGPAQAAVPAGSCGEGTTFAVSSGPSVDATLVSSVTDVLAERGFTEAPASSADLSATIAPASEIAQSGSSSVMAVALSTGVLDPATATEGTDWVAVTGSAGDAADQLLEEACGPLPSEDPAGTEEGDEEGDLASEETAATGPTAVSPASTQADTAREQADQTQESATAATQESAAAAPATGAAQSAAATAKASSSTSAARVDKNCADFGSQAEAQSFFTSQGGPASDPHGLDRDRDGQACEVHFGAGSEAATVAASAGSDKDCADFGSQAEAQSFFTGQGGPARDDHRLDADDDGQACEDHFGGDNASRAEARTIHAGLPSAGSVSPVGVAGGVLLAGAGLAVGLRARRS